MLFQVKNDRSFFNRLDSYYGKCYFTFLRKHKNLIKSKLTTKLPYKTQIKISETYDFYYAAQLVVVILEVNPILNNRAFAFWYALFAQRRILSR